MQKKGLSRRVTVLSGFASLRGRLPGLPDAGARLPWGRGRVPPPGVPERHHGFTLVELLVVIAIISVLAGLLLPALEQALEASLRIKCANRMRQMYLTVAFYAGDYQDTLPAGMCQSVPSTYGRAPVYHYSMVSLFFDYWRGGEWPDGLDGMLDAIAKGRWHTGGRWLLRDDYSDFYCPTTRASSSYLRGGRTYFGYWWTGFSSDYGRYPDANGVLWFRLSAVATPSGGVRKALLQDMGAYGKAGSKSYEVAPYSCHPDANDTLFGTGKNVLFGDGSVQWQTGAHLLRYRPAFQDMALAGEAYSIINHARDYLLILGPDGTVTRNKQTDPSYNASEVHYNRLYR